MAEHITKSYTCDRCRKELGCERPRRTQKATVRASFHYQEGPGPAFDWQDLCDECDQKVKLFFVGGK